MRAYLFEGSSAADAARRAGWSVATLRAAVRDFRAGKTGRMSMTVEQRLAESIRSFHLDALSSAVPLNVDLDVVLSVLAGAVCASLRRRLTGYQAATPDTLQRRFLSTGGVIINQADTIVVRLKRRTYSPLLRQADIPEVAVPWWHRRRLRFEFD